ncbi:unnamed protein product [Bursaphelenchus okinawaensis]|uniref:BZIP domain-containing protein n=1 Tax=Bursaphelenchus okinawaensis TaxID=465554 RepID=A0A811KS41_9BILA|nr:unnamed protein product [Bursaphelenchus okinawaensis]CAG9112243.1 unnamed protein product [Bursaphelenchus okinawaensis]
MTSRFNGEDLVKRSLFVSLIGLKKKNKDEAAKKEPSNPWSNFNVNDFNESTDPCSTSTLLSHDIQPVDQLAENLLTDQMQDVLLTSPPPDTPNVASPLDIYHEIVNECANFEQQPIPPYYDKQVDMLAWTPELPPHPMTPTTNYPPPCYTATPEPVMCPNCHYISNPIPVSQSQQYNGITIPHTVNGISIEELVKMIISKVKNSPEEVKETPEETLKRKRQQNNEAAARYRKRQREEKGTKSGEYDELFEKNKLLKIQIGQIQKEMSSLRKHILSNK